MCSASLYCIEIEHFIADLDTINISSRNQLTKRSRFLTSMFICHSLLWCHNRRDGVSNHLPHNCLLNCLFRHRSKKTSKPRVTGLCVGNSPVTGEFPAQMASNAENVSIWWRFHVNIIPSEAKQSIIPAFEKFIIRATFWIMSSIH